MTSTDGLRLNSRAVFWTCLLGILAPSAAIPVPAEGKFPLTISAPSLLVRCPWTARLRGLTPFVSQEGGSDVQAGPTESEPAVGAPDGFDENQIRKGER